MKTTIRKKNHLPNIHFGFHVSFRRGGGNSGKLLVQNFKHRTYNGPMVEPWEFPLLGVVYGTVKIHAKGSICWLKKNQFQAPATSKSFFATSYVGIQTSI